MTICYDTVKSERFFLQALLNQANTDSCISNHLCKMVNSFPDESGKVLIECKISGYV